jgi:hypothetical protein
VRRLLNAFPRPVINPYPLASSGSPASSKPVLFEPITSEMVSFQALLTKIVLTTIGVNAVCHREVVHLRGRISVKANTAPDQSAFRL